eukprot:756954-Hanusia_phi.AAC.1
MAGLTMEGRAEENGGVAGEEKDNAGADSASRAEERSALHPFEGMACKLVSIGGGVRWEEDSHGPDIFRGRRAFHVIEQGDGVRLSSGPTSAGRQHLWQLVRLQEEETALRFGLRSMSSGKFLASGEDGVMHIWLVRLEAGVHSDMQSRFDGPLLLQIPREAARLLIGLPCKQVFSAFSLRGSAGYLSVAPGTHDQEGSGRDEKVLRTTADRRKKAGDFCLHGLGGGAGGCLWGWSSAMKE